MGTTPVNSNSSQSQVTNTVNDIGRQVQQMQTVQVFKDDSGVRRVILDKDGLRVSEEGVDVYEATDDQLNFNSNNNVFKIVNKGSILVTKSASSTVGTQTVAHGLSYIPAVITYVKISSLSNQYVLHPYIQSSVSGASVGLISEFTRVLVSATDITFDYIAPNTGAANSQYPNDVTAEFIYYLLQETAN